MNRNNFIKKFVIGSANFVKKYGLNASIINPIEIKKILNLAKINNINKIDTADSYMNKYNIFKKISEKFDFITKMKPDQKRRTF